MRLLKQGMATGINFSESNIEPCETCITAKQTKKPFPKKSFKRAKQKLELIHSDLCGPMDIGTISCWASIPLDIY